MAKRTLDLLVALTGLIVLSPLLATILFLVWRQDGHSPFYAAERAGMRGRSFKMIKIRSMTVNADRTGVESTSADDNRITALGHFIRRWKLDELSQLLNVLKGNMSLVGPRPNTLRGVASYSSAERRLLEVRPGITDFSSIVFSDEGAILAGSTDPDADYDRLIRPWKSRLGLFYVDHASPMLDLQLIWLTLVAIFDKPTALARISRLLARFGAGSELREVSLRRSPLDQHLRTAP